MRMEHEIPLNTETRGSRKAKYRDRRIYGFKKIRQD